MEPKINYLLALLPKLPISQTLKDRIEVLLRSSRLSSSQLSAIETTLINAEDQQADEEMTAALDEIFIKRGALDDISNDEWEGLSGRTT